MEIVWHMHHRGDSVSEGGSQAGRRKRRVRESERDTEKTREKRQEGGDALPKLGQLHFQRLILTR